MILSQRGWFDECADSDFLKYHISYRAKDNESAAFGLGTKAALPLFCSIFSLKQIGSVLAVRAPVALSMASLRTALSGRTQLDQIRPSERLKGSRHDGG